MNKLLIFFIAIVSGCTASSSQSNNIISKEIIDLKTDPIWDIIAENDTLKPEFNYLENLNVYSIIYKSDSIDVKGLTIEPKSPGNYPVIIFNRGGNRDYYDLSVKMLVYSTSVLANDGYIILASNYREQDEFGGKDLNDVLNLMNSAHEIPNADTSRIGMFGWSRGGIMTYLSLKASNRIKAAVIGNGASDLFMTIKNRPNMEINPISQCIPNYYENKEAELTKRSAIFWADSLSTNSSLLLLCGLQDKRISYHQSVNMADKLEQIGYDFELKKFDTDHSFRNKKAELNRELLVWFNNKLKK